jgi:hypothetical protein
MQASRARYREVDQEEKAEANCGEFSLTGRKNISEVKIVATMDRALVGLHYLLELTKSE